MAEGTKKSSEAMDKAFEALLSYEWGVDPEALDPMDSAVLACHDQPAARQELEKRLASVLQTDVHRAAKDFVCRKLGWIGSADSVPALAALLPDKNLSTMARHALEKIANPEADKALRESLAKVEGDIKIGVINSLGVRRDCGSASLLAAQIDASAPEVMAAAANALGRIGTSEAAKALETYRGKAPKEFRWVASDASLACAQRLLAAGKKKEAVPIFKALGARDQAKHVRLAASRALSAATRM